MFSVLEKEILNLENPGENQKIHGFKFSLRHRPLKIVPGEKQRTSHYDFVRTRSPDEVVV